MKLSKKAQNGGGLDAVLSESLPLNQKVFPEYWQIKDEAFGIKFEGSFQDDRRLDKESPKKLNDIAERFLREVCARNGIFFKDIYAYWRFSWNEFHHPHSHITILLRSLHKSRPQLIKLAKTARRVWKRQNAANGKGEVFIKEKGTRQRVHSYALRTNEGVFNRIGMTARLNRLLMKRSDRWPKEDTLKYPQNEPIEVFQKSSGESRGGVIPFTNPPARSAPILEVKRTFLPKSPRKKSRMKQKILGFWDKMTHFLKKIALK